MRYRWWPLRYFVKVMQGDLQKDGRLEILKFLVRNKNKVPTEHALGNCACSQDVP